MRVNELFAFIRERHAIWERRKAGKPKPWTADRILQSYRFCNVYRELDTVTQWIAKNWREPHKCDLDLWFAMIVARKVNYPESLADIGYPSPWNSERFKAAIGNRIAQGKQVEGGAYMITAGTGPRWIGQPKYIFLADAVFGPMWKDRAKIRPSREDTLASFHARLQHAGMTVGSFIAGQVVADLKYVRPLKDAKDWWTWAAMGPGSQRGLNRVLDLPVTVAWKPEEWLKRLQELQSNIDPLVRKARMERIHAQDLQNCLCEFDKYERVRLLEGRPRSLYNGR